MTQNIAIYELHTGYIVINAKTDDGESTWDYTVTSITPYSCIYIMKSFEHILQNYFRYQSSCVACVASVASSNTDPSIIGMSVAEL